MGMIGRLKKDLILMKTESPINKSTRSKPALLIVSIINFLCDWNSFAADVLVEMGYNEL